MKKNDLKINFRPYFEDVVIFNLSKFIFHSQTRKTLKKAIHLVKNIVFKKINIFIDSHTFTHFQPLAGWLVLLALFKNLSIEAAKNKKNIFSSRVSP